MDKITAIITRHWKFLVGWNVLVIAATAGMVVTAPRVWTASAQLILPDATSNLDANLGTLGSLKNADPNFSNQVNPLKVQASILTSDALLERVWVNDPERKANALKPRGYGNSFKVSPQDQTTIILLQANGSSPNIARQRLIALTQAYQQRLNELRQANSTAREEFSQKELEKAKQNLEKAQTELAQFQKASGLVNSEEQTRGIVNTLGTLTTAQAQALASAQSSSSQVLALSARLNATPEKAVRSLGLGENQDYQSVRTQLTNIEAQLVKARETYTDEHPLVRDLLGQRQNLQNRLQQYIAQAAGNAGVDPTVTTSGEGRATLIQQLILAESQAKAFQGQADRLQTQIDRLRTTLAALPANQARLQELQRQYNVAEGVYKGSIAQVKQSNIDAFNSYPNVQVLDPPSVDMKPSSPKKSIAAINAFLASVIGSIALLLLLEARNPLLSPKDLQSIAFPIVVRIPRLKHFRMESQLGLETEVEFQQLASAISLQSLKANRLLITSAGMGEGKTTVTLGLATALADLGFKVLLVDGDFRQAELSRRLGYVNESDLSENPVKIQPSIDLLPTTPKQRKVVELVRRGRFEQTLASAQSSGDYDYVLVDSAPVSLTSETALMVNAIPSVLFVVRPGTSKRNPVNDSLNQLSHHKAKLLGLVINGTEMPTKPYAYRSNVPVETELGSRK